MKKYSVITALIVFVCGCFFTAEAFAVKHKILVVMSYEQDNPWCQSIKDGIDSVLSESSELIYFYMDTKKDFKGGKQKAEQAYALFQQVQPDGVITVDDNAQWMFVLPYLKGKTDVPVMFCGVNADAEKYDYPTSHISGTLERGHIRESIAFTKQLYPSLTQVLVLAKDSPSGRALKKQIEKESDSYLAGIKGVKLVTEMKELKTIESDLCDSCALFIDSLEGLPNDLGVPLKNDKITKILLETTNNPIIGANQYHVEDGAFCAVVKTGEEQGETAASMLLKALQGTPVSDLPVTRNYKGKRIINVTTMRSLGIQPKPRSLIGVKLVTTKK